MGGDMTSEIFKGVLYQLITPYLEYRFSILGCTAIGDLVGRVIRQRVDDNIDDNTTPINEDDF